MLQLKSYMYDMLRVFFVNFVIQHEMPMRSNVFRMWLVLLYHTFPYYLIKDTTLGL